MNKTIIYLSEDTAQLEALDLDVYFPEAKLHPREAVKQVPDLTGKSFCTHSEAIINKFGYLIAEKILDCDNVEIRHICKINGAITSYSFDKEGYLIDWTIGFFAEDI